MPPSVPRWQLSPVPIAVVVVEMHHSGSWSDGGGSLAVTRRQLPTPEISGMSFGRTGGENEVQYNNPEHPAFLGADVGGAAAAPAGHRPLFGGNKKIPYDTVRYVPSRFLLCIFLSQSIFGI
jgi:hypothetical protein